MYWLPFACLAIICTVGGCKQSSWALWNAYSSRFIDAQGRVYDPQTNDRTTSEAQAYALFFALADNDRACFNRILNWTQSNLAQGDLTVHLPAWLWGKDQNGQWKTLDSNSAADADTWMAYTLVEAGRLWNAADYTRLGRAMMALIAGKEVTNLPGFGPMLMPAPQGFRHGNSWTLNPSYLPLFLFQRFAGVDPAGPWGQIAMAIPVVMEQSARHGYAMDWVEYVPGDGFSPVEIDRGAGPPKEGPGGSYDAIRVYLWAGMQDDSGNARDMLLNAVLAMSVYLADHDAPRKRSAMRVFRRRKMDR